MTFSAYGWNSSSARLSRWCSPRQDDPLHPPLQRGQTLPHTSKIGRPGLQAPDSFLPPVPSALTEIPDDSHRQRRQGANEGPKESSRGCFHTLASLSVAERAS